MVEVLQTYHFAAGGNGERLLRAGWADPEPEFVWSIGDHSTIALPCPENVSNLRIDITVEPFVLPPRLRYQRGSVSLRGGSSQVGSRLGGRATWQIAVPNARVAPTFTIDLDRATPAYRAPELIPGETRDLGFRLHMIEVLRGKPVVLPPARRAMMEWRFGWNETTEACLIEGWGEPEEGFVWAVGRTSILELAIEPSLNPDPGLLLLDMRPVDNEDGSARQRIAVSVDDRPLRYLDLRRRVTVALQITPRSNAESVSLRFDHLDAAGPADRALHASGMPLAWALASARLMPLPQALPPGFLPRLLPPGPHQFEDGSLERSIRNLTGLAPLDLMRRLESLVGGCWLGNLQARFGLMPIGLLTFNAIPQHQLVEGVLSGFADLGRPDRKLWGVRIEEDTTWRIFDTLSELSIATPYPRNVAPPTDGLARASVSLPWLAEKLMQDIAAGEKLFVTRLMEFQDEAVALAILAALRRYGDAELLWVVEDGSMPPGSVMRLPSGLLKGDKGFDEETMISVLANAYALLHPPAGG